MSRAPELDLSQPDMGGAQRHYQERSREILRLRLGSPKRSSVEQRDLAGTPLFDPELSL